MKTFFTLISFGLLISLSCKKPKDEVPQPPNPPPPPPTYSVPTVSTEVTEVSGTVITVKGTISNEGGLAITSRDFYWAKSFTAVRTKVTAAGNGTFTTNISGLSPGDSVYVYAAASNSKGEGKGNEVATRTTPPPPPPVHYVGEDLGFAIVFKLEANGYWFAAKQDTVSGAGSTGKQWDGLFPNHPSCNALSLTDGKANTLAIMAIIAGPSAARAAHSYTAGGQVPPGTFFLGAKNQMVELKQLSGSIPGLAGTFPGDPVWHRYCTSTESSTAVISAIYVSANSGNAYEDAKSGDGNIRPIGFRQN